MATRGRVTRHRFEALRAAACARPRRHLFFLSSRPVHRSCFSPLPRSSPPASALPRSFSSRHAQPQPLRHPPLIFSVFSQNLAHVGKRWAAHRAMVGPCLWRRSMTASVTARTEGALPAAAPAPSSRARRDEPATGACANSHFYCPNIGHQGMQVAVSRVNGELQIRRAVRRITRGADAICDCCDGRLGARVACLLRSAVLFTFTYCRAVYFSIA